MLIAAKKRRNTVKAGFPIFVFLTIFAIYASGQSKYKIEYYSTEQGLSHQRVTSILKDREGFMWFGSWDGINRFDGHTFVSYKSFSGDRSQLGNDRIDQIVEDQSSHLWIRDYDWQIYRFDKKTEQYEPLSVIINQDAGQKVTFSRILAASNGWVWLQSEDEGLFCVPQTNLSKGHYKRYKKGLDKDHRLPSNTINLFHQDSEHRIWVGTPEGLCCLTPSASGSYKSSNIIPPNIASGLNITSIYEAANHLYFGTADGNLVVCDKGLKSFSVRKIANTRLNAILHSRKSNVIYATTNAGTLIIHSLADQKNTSINYRTGEPLYTLFEDSKGKLWIEPEKMGAICFDPFSRSFQYFFQNNGESLNYIGNRYRILEDDNGQVWVNMKGGGFGYYHHAKGSIEYFLPTIDAGNHHLPNIVYSIYYDKAGVLWLTTNERDLIKIVQQENDFKQQLLVEHGLSKSDNEVRGIYFDHKNRLWLGVKRGNLSILQSNKQVTELFDNAPPQGLGGVYTIIQDRRGNMWLGTKGNGLFKATPLNKEGTKYHLTHFQADKAHSGSLPCNDIYALLEDQQGRIWIGSFDEGLILLDDDQDSVRFIRADLAFKNYPKKGFRKIRHMALDQAGHIWLGTTNGLLLLDARDLHTPVIKYATYSKIPGDGESLANNDVQFIFRDSKNRMWLATSGGGFCQAIGGQSLQSLKFRNYTTREGLPNDYVLSCAEDKRGNLWIATENGISKFNPEDEIFRNFDSYDGLPKVSFSEASAIHCLENGQLVFGTFKGYLSFHPDFISTNRIHANIVFTNLQINNEDAGPGLNGSVISEDINYISGLTLKYDQNIISIDYALLDHRAGNRQEFAYRLLGFDSAWHDDRQIRRATYTNLPPGSYVFEVKSTSTDLYSNTPYKSLAITILPPPWKTWWAYLIYVVLIGVVFAIIRRYALTMIRLRHKIAVEQKLAALKLNFFTNVSHELRTPLTLIVNPLEQLFRKEKLSPEGSAYVDVARKNASRMVRFINQLLDLRKIQSNKAQLQISRVEMLTFVKKISDHFTEAARSKRIRLEISSDQKELYAWVDAEKLEVVIYNLLSNALKFSPEGKVVRLLIQSIPGEESFSIAVSDQGPGVAKEKLEDIFELFHEGDHAAGRELKGTGIGLALCREFVHLHAGTIWAANNEDGGLTVTLKLKSGPHHYPQTEVAFVDLPQTTPVYGKPIEQQILQQPLPAAITTDQKAPLVLLVEDNDDLRAFIKGQLSEFYRVETAKDGEEGLQKAVNLLPDLIVSDIMMPVMDGIQMLDKVKNDMNTSHIPVVLLSAKYSIESQLEGLKYGADYYITKPFNNEFLMASIENLIRQRKKLFEALVERKKSLSLSPEPIVVTSKDEIFLKEVIRVVEAAMSDPDFTVESLAVTMNMNPNTFYKKFKSLTSLMPVEFVRDMRLQRAKQYLDAGGNNVSEVAYLAGFSNPKYFSTCFKEKYHVSPSEYLKSKGA